MGSMNDTAIKNFCTWARTALIEGVAQRMERYDVSEGAETGLTAVGALVLSPQEAAWRDDLLRLCREEGAGRLRDRAAYTWFNRIAAVRYMEVHDFLPSRVRMFTRPAADGSWELGSQAVDEALDLQVEGIDPARVAELKQAGEDEPLFRYLFLAQCDELSGCLPGVFQPVDACMALLLPANLMDPDGVVGRMVGDIDEADWGDVQILGWMYQYYNAERKVEVDAAVKKGKKVQKDDLAPKTQLFTPDWIVRYMVQNSLGRLWMLNNPSSSLREQMEYYIDPDAEHENFAIIEGPEGITFCDPACGSAHILVYAFELLVAMYRERGYRDRDIPELILTKNLAGMEIDPRAGQIAGLALAMCARGLDRRFFRRGVRADIETLRPVSFEDGEIPRGCALAKKKDLMEALAHLDEVGSLLCPDSSDLAAIREAIALCEGNSGGLFAATAVPKLERALDTCEKLARRFDCVVANPPYLGSSGFNPFMTKWIKEHYADVKGDLCTCFITRIFSLTGESGFAGLATSNSWMFLSSYEALRQRLVEEKTIDSLVQLSVHGFHGIAAQVCTFVIRNKHVSGYRGGYVRLNDFDHWTLQEGKTLEAIQNPDCGWFYRRDAETFKQIPGTPIAYWASDALLSMFVTSASLKEISEPKQGLATADNERFLRLWWEPCHSAIGFDCASREAAKKTHLKWFPMTKGGEFRRWYGNLVYVVNWEDDGREIRNFVVDGKLKSRPQNLESYFKPGLSWSAISSGSFAMRRSDSGIIPNAKGPCCVVLAPEKANYLLAVSNTSVFMRMLEFISPTLDYSQGPLGKVPVPLVRGTGAEAISENNVSLSRADWDTFETSWNFKRNPLV